MIILMAAVVTMVVARNERFEFSFLVCSFTVIVFEKNSHHVLLKINKNSRDKTKSIKRIIIVKNVVQIGNSVLIKYRGIRIPKIPLKMISLKTTFFNGNEVFPVSTIFNPVNDFASVLPLKSQ